MPEKPQIYLEIFQFKNAVEPKSIDDRQNMGMIIRRVAIPNVVAEWYRDFDSACSKFYVTRGPLYFLEQIEHGNDVEKHLRMYLYWNLSNVIRYLTFSQVFQIGGDLFPKQGETLFMLGDE